MRYLKNPVCWIALAFICYLLSLFVLTTWASILFSIAGIGLSLAALQLLLNRGKKKNKRRRYRKLTMYEKAMFAAVVVVIALCVSTNFNLLAPVCWIVAIAAGVWFLNECLEECVKEEAKRKAKKRK
jgi:dipeptide/tripeptide permease